MAVVRFVVDDDHRPGMVAEDAPYDLFGGFDPGLHARRFLGSGRGFQVRVPGQEGVPVFGLEMDEAQVLFVVRRGQSQDG